MKKNEAKTVATAINEKKKLIDSVKLKLEEFHCLNQFSVDHTNNDELILEESEFKLIKQLQALKNEYRFNRDLLETLNSDIAYCEQLVKQCRKVLLSEFSCWYEEAFGHILSKQTSQTNPEQISSTLKFSLKEHDGERFENVQKNLLMKSPESYTFYNARMQTERRRLYNDISRKQHILPKLKNTPQFLPIFTK